MVNILGSDCGFEEVDCVGYAQDKEESKASENDDFLHGMVLVAGSFPLLDLSADRLSHYRLF